MSRGITDSSGAPLRGGTRNLPIDAAEPYNDASDSFVKSKQTWLKTGVVETDLSLYPDAFSSLQYSGFNFSIAPQLSLARGMCFDGTNFWIIDQILDTVFEFTPTGTYTGSSFDITPQDTSPTDIEWDGTNFWVIGTTNDRAFRYNAAGVYSGVSFLISGQDTFPNGIVWDGSNFWIYGNATNTIYQYNSAGTYTGFSFATTEVVNPQGLTYNGTDLVAIESVGAKFLAYSTAGAFLGEVLDALSGHNAATWDGTNYWSAGGSVVATYDIVVGSAVAYVDPDTSYPIYLRVK